LTNNINALPPNKSCDMAGASLAASAGVIHLGDRCSRDELPRRLHLSLDQIKCLKFIRVLGGAYRGCSLQLTTARKHGCQFPTAQKDWLGRETTMPLNPGTNRARIGGSDEASLSSGGILPTLPVDPARRVEAQYGLWGDADPISWDRAQHERAGGEAWSIDHYSLTGLPQDREQFEIRPYLTARTCQNAYIGASRRRRDEK
jgi:hypothetical protein